MGGGTGWQAVDSNRLSLLVALPLSHAIASIVRQEAKVLGGG